MYVIIVYDVSIERVNKIRVFLRQYLTWVQNSVFEGDLTPSELEKIKSQLKILLKDGDFVIIYYARDKKLVKRETIGSEKGFTSTLI